MSDTIPNHAAPNVLMAHHSLSPVLTTPIENMEVDMRDLQDNATLSQAALIIES